LLYLISEFGIVVPEFETITMTILGIFLIGIVVISKKYETFSLKLVNFSLALKISRHKNPFYNYI